MRRHDPGMNDLSDDDRAAYERDGFLIRRGVVTPGEAAALAAHAARYAAEAPDRARLNRLTLHHAHPTLDAAPLLAPLARPAILGLSEALLGAPAMARYYCLNIEIPSADTSMRWHRDSGFFHAPSARVDAAAWRGERPFSQVQWNLALIPDDCLRIVPGSHHREPTAAEAPFLALDERRDGMPGELIVDLAPGDAVVYHCDLLHGVCNPRPRPRLTVHWYWLRAGAHDPTGPGVLGQLAPAEFTRRLAAPLAALAVEASPG